MNNVFRGDFIVAQTEVIFFRRKKKKKPTPKRSILLITHDTVALTDPNKDGKPILMFPRNTITNFRHNTDDTQYKLEVSVWIKDKTHELCIEFPTDDAKQQRDTFIKHFENDKAKPIPNNQIQSQTHIKTEPNTNAPNTNNQPIKPDTKIKSQNSHINAPNTQQLSRRGTKRKHQTMNEETLRKRACKLAKHKYLATLYKTLVGKNVLTPHEFWDEYGADIDIKHTSSGLIEGMSNMVLTTTINNQTWSLFSEFKDDLNDNENNINDDDKKNKLSINLTAERILKIFVNLAEVKLAYDKNVPFNFTEKEFWKSFLQSHYFKRETTRNVTSGISDKETQMDKLLKKYLIELKRNKINKRNEIHTASSSGNNKYRINNDNSFAKQLQKIQLKRNLEVDAQGAKKRMTDDIAQARAIKDGKNILIKQIESGDINVNDKGECMDIIVKVKQQCNGDINGDIDMKNMKNNNQHKQEKQVNYRRKLNIEDASVDLSLTQDSFIELIQDPGIDDGKNMRRDDIQHWFSQVNKHGMMLLYQSINQNNKYKDKKNMEELMINVPKVNYGSKYKMEINEYENEEDLDNDICVEMGDNGLDMNYLDRLKRITEFEDLKFENSKNFIELKIKDQSVYWGDNLLLDDQQLTRNNQVAKQLNAYLGQVQDKKKKLAESDVVNLIQPKYCNMIISDNTENNYKNNMLNRINERYDNKNDVLMIYNQNSNDINYKHILQTERILSQHELNLEKIISLSIDDVKRIVKDEMCQFITQNTFDIMFKGFNEWIKKENIKSKLNYKYIAYIDIANILFHYAGIKANKKILDQLSDFQKPMKELVRHYWNCFPANKQKLEKSKIIVTQLKDYKATLVQFQNSLDKKTNDYRMQKVLLQELIDLANKVLQHNKITQDTLEKKKLRKNENVNSHKMNVDK